MENYPAMKQKEQTESVVVMCMNLEPIIQHEVSQKEKNIICQCIDMESRKMVQMKAPAGQV